MIFPHDEVIGAVGGDGRRDLIGGRRADGEGAEVKDYAAGADANAVQVGPRGGAIAIILPDHQIIGPIRGGCGLLFAR